MKKKKKWNCKICTSMNIISGIFVRTSCKLESIDVKINKSEFLHFWNLKGVLVDNF